MELNFSFVRGALTKKNILYFLFRSFLVALPFICPFIISLCFGYKGSFDFFVPVWKNDEMEWWSQIDSLIHYGKPLGYFGYNEWHAPIGTFGSWGIAPLIPYALFGSVFGWAPNSMAIANMFFLSLALLFFLLLTKPSSTQIFYLVAAYLSLYIIIGYSLTSMSEGLRYALAIILTGFIIWLIKITEDPESKMSKKQKILFALGLAFSFYCILVYLIFSLVVFVVILLVLRNTKIKLPLKIFFAGVTMILVAAVSYKLVGLVSTPYTKPSTIQNIVEQIKTQGLYEGICYMLNNFFNNLGTLNYPEIGNVSGDYRGILVWYFLSYEGLLFFLLRKLIQNLKSKENNVVLLLAIYFLLGFLVGCCLLYTNQRWTLCRVINTGLIMAIFFLIYGNEKKFISGYALISFLAVVSVWTYYGTLINERYETAKFEQQMLTEKEKLSEVIEILPDADPWENTVDVWGGFNFMHISLPSGAGINHVYGAQSCQNAKYVVLLSSVDEQSISDVESMGYSVVLKDDVFVVLVNEKY